MDSNRRITEKLLRYWLSKRGNRPFPERRDIIEDDLADIWESCFLAEPGNHYIYLGKKLEDAFGGDMINPETAIFLASPFTLHIEKKFTQVIDIRKPVEDEATLPNSRKDIIKYRLILLPLGGKTGRIDQILGAMRWKKAQSTL